MKCKYFKDFRRHVDQLLINISGRSLPLDATLRINLTGLKNYSRGSYRILKILLITMNHVVWLARNKAKHENIKTSTRDLIAQFQARIKTIIVKDHLRLNKTDFINLWYRTNVFFVLDDSNNIVNWNYAENLRIAYSGSDRINMY